MLVEEKTSGDLRTKRLLDERARLEESIRELHKNSELEQRKNYENLQTAKQKKAEVENIRIKLDQGTIFHTKTVRSALVGRTDSELYVAITGSYNRKIRFCDKS